MRVACLSSLLVFAHLLGPSEATGIAKSFRAMGTLQPREVRGQSKRRGQGDEHTFLHSGESVRPHVLQIYCSPPNDFLG